MNPEFDDILYTVANGVATITINRPQKLNSVTAHSLREIEVAFDAAGKDPEVGVVVFTGAGEKSFCAGADVYGRKTARWATAARRNSPRRTSRFHVAPSQ